MLPPPALSSDDWLQDDNYSTGLMNRVRGRLDDERACTCGGVRTFTLLCGNSAQAAHIRDALCSHLAAHVDPGALLAGETHTMTAQEYVDSKHVPKSRSGAPVPGLYLKMGRFPIELLPAQGAPAASLPLDPQWLGWWYGDGDHDAPSIAAAAIDEAAMRRKCQTIVDELDAHKPEGMDPVHLAVNLIPANDSGAVRSRQDCYRFRIAGTGRPGTHWNPYVDRMRALGIWANHKETGIPEVYKTATEEARAALLAGLMDTDGWLMNNRTAYGLSQSVKHRRLIEDAREVAIGLGIKVGRLRQYWAPDPAGLVDENHDDEDQNENRDENQDDEDDDQEDIHDHNRNRDRNRNRGFEQLAFGMLGPNLAKLQPHVALTRKRVRSSWIDSELRALLVEEAAGPVMGRRITLPGHEITTIQLRDGYVVYADAPAAPQVEP